MAYTTIDDPTAHFQTQLHTGTSGGGDEIVFDGNSAMQPDMIWVKARTTAYWHQIHDSSRGAGDGAIYPNTTAAGSTSYIDSFDSDGWQEHNANDAISANGDNVVTWAWKANGGTTTSVSESGSGNGGINACTYQANTTAGFSIIKYTGHRGSGIGDNNHTNVTHGLSSAPTFVIIKNLQSGHTLPWVVLGTELGEYSGSFANRHMKLNDNSARDGGDYVSNVAPSSSYVFVGNNNDVNGDGHEFIMYAWHEVQGYSKFGIYEGNGAVPNGTFIYKGFKPRFVLIKNIDAVESWIMYDTKRDPFNLTSTKLSPDQANVENGASGIGDAAYNNIDIYSNGFKCKSNNAAANGADKTILYMAFAQEPFVTSSGVPATAR